MMDSDTDKMLAVVIVTTVVTKMHLNLSLHLELLIVCTKMARLRSLEVGDDDQQHLPEEVHFDRDPSRANITIKVTA
jgi:hypothetical protein